jgi:hypothetical protein
MLSVHNLRGFVHGSIVEILTFLVVLIEAGALIVFFLIYQGNYYSASTELSSVQKSLTQVEQQLKDVELEFVNQQKVLEIYKATAENAEKSLQILERIRPHADIEIDPKIRGSGQDYEVHFTLANSGQHLAKANPKEFYILSKPIDNSSQITKDDFIEYSLSKGPTVTSIDPGETVTHRYFFRLKGKPRSTLYFYVKYIIETDPVIVQQVEKYAESLKLHSVKELASAIATFEGTIERKRSN